MKSEKKVKTKNGFDFSSVSEILKTLMNFYF